MTLIKLSFRDGGLDGFDAKPSPEKTHISISKRFSSAKRGDGKFNILTDSALKGVVSYLSGEIARIDKVVNPDIDLSVSSKKCLMTTQPFFTSMTERYDYQEDVDPPTYHFNGVKLIECNAVTSLFSEEISKAFGTDDAESVYKSIYRPGQKSIYVETKADLEILIGLIKSSNLKCEVSARILLRAEGALSRISTIGTQQIKINEKTGIQKEVLTDTVVFLDCFVSAKVVLAWTLIINKIIQFPEIASGINRAAPLLSRTKKWAQRPAPHVSGITYLLKADFDVFIEVTESLLSKIVNGPGIAHWAHGGLVEWELCDKVEVDAIATSDNVVYNIKKYQDKPVKKPKVGKK